MPELVPPLRTQVRESPVAITGAEVQRALLPRVNMFVVTSSSYQMCFSCSGTADRNPWRRHGMMRRNVASPCRTTGRIINIPARTTALGKSVHCTETNKTTQCDSRYRGWQTLPTDEPHGNSLKPAATTDWSRLPETAVKGMICRRRNDLP